MQTALSHLECSRCGHTYSADKLHNLCSCGGPLLARYELERAARTFNPRALSERPPTLWRYRELLPVRTEPVTLGEGMTPLIRTERLGARLGLVHLWVKDEGMNPTGTFKARGLAVAVSRARELGARTLAIPTAGNAGGALAAYAARAGLGCVVVMPADTPRANEIECRAAGAEVIKLDGLIADCARFVAEHGPQEDWFEVSTLKEPYRIEGKKTMGLELWEQFGGRLPEVVVYPTGGGVGLIGMWKAFDELEHMGLLRGRRPRMVAVQASGCAPVVEAFERGETTCRFWDHAATIASGLRVPRPLGDFLILRILRESSGRAVAVSDTEILAAAQQLMRLEGIFAAPEGAAGVAAVQHLRQQGWIDEQDSVVIFNTGSGYKYLDLWESALAQPAGQTS
jgi:threonine synthase